MRKYVISVLLVVVMLFSFHNAIAEKSMEELDNEFDQLMHEYQQLTAVQEVLKNGLRVYPDNGWEAEYGFKCDTVLPAMADPEEAKAYIGMPYLLTCTVLQIKGYGLDIQLDDGRLGIVSLDTYDFSKKEMVSFGNGPILTGKYNIYCTFTGMSHELIADDCLHFMISVTEDARQFALK